MNITHVEMYDSRSFCGEDGDAIGQDGWHDDPAAVSQATCLQCLERIKALGAKADQSMRIEIACGATIEIQREIMQAERAERDRLRRESGATTLTLASFDGILKERYR